MKYRHLFFDLDHTLWDFDANAMETLADVYKELDLQAAGVNDFDLFCKHYLHHNAILWDRYHHGYISADDLKWKRMWRTLLEFKNGSEELARKMSGYFLEVLPTKQNLFPYTHEILRHLKEKEYKLHLITNGFEKTQWRKLDNSKLGSYFEEVITSERSNSVKPNKEIFEYALHITGAQVHESIMIGDNLDADIQGAINAGMDSIFVNHIKSDLKGVQPTYVIHHLQELETIFE
ncbi:YjjG family noncanonical pyrimidine nucleotidase [Lacibacter sediminis]|uniref:Noncanonical pyrimidine nucleotidase, YjjG family n=1 Tax=Lacibacter sediminis TaxID=2760713 RepID=A0A7G5XHG2_9BACT|nr:YjjG family noncanonical pyrimidine nucleotidase [Lacibacter sediminis]QNA44915.1 noncanonical pyrimidine nucleotidase, YjjG family [Lacibacter sediminis]